MSQKHNYFCFAIAIYILHLPEISIIVSSNWTSSNQDIVRVTGSGKKAAIQVKNLSSKGNAIITAKDENVLFSVAFLGL